MELSLYLCQDEVKQLDQAFNISLQHDSELVFWTGISPGLACDWARRNGLKTLTMAMGNLYTENSRKPLRSAKRSKFKSWSRYMKGASWIFAQHACQGRRAIVLTNAPPHVYSKRKHSSYREIEEPILKGFEAGQRTNQIDYVHPNIPDAAGFRYQVWPKDWSAEWFGFLECIAIKDIVRRFVQRTRVRRLEKVEEAESVSIAGHQRSTFLPTVNEKSYRIVQEKNLTKLHNVETHQLAAQQAARDRKIAKRLKFEREQQAAQDKRAAKRLKLEREQQAAQDKRVAKRLKLEKEQQAAQDKKAAKRLKLEKEQQAAQDKRAAKR
ncbi:hypothetical protein KC331_g13882, partial [Hortaea werneckii]